MREKYGPNISGIDYQLNITEVKFFVKFLPTKWIKKSLLPVMSEKILENGKNETNMPELMGWLGYWLDILLH